MRPEPRASAITSAAASSKFVEPTFIPSELPIASSLASLCSYDDDDDAADSSAIVQVPPPTTVVALDHNAEFKPAVTPGPPSTFKSKSFPDRRAPHNSGKRPASALPIQQSKLLCRSGSGRGNLLEKLLQKEATADLRTILLCFRAFASRGLV
jgi:hypothetical protein